MLIYKNNNSLVTTSLGDPYRDRNRELQLISFDADHFGAKDNRFYKIKSVESIPRSIKHPTRESMELAATRRFRQLTPGYYGSTDSEYYDEINDVWYKVYMKGIPKKDNPKKGNPIIFSYSMVYPAITDFFKYWDNSWYNSSKNVDGISSPFDLSRLFNSMDNFHDLSSMFSKESGEQLKNLLYQSFPEFAIFYYEIYPYLTIKILKTYDITKLISARLQVYELGLNTNQLDQLISSIPIAENNAKVLSLIKRA